MAITTTELSKYMQTHRLVPESFLDPDVFEAAIVFFDIESETPITRRDVGEQILRARDRIVAKTLSALENVSERSQSLRRMSSSAMAPFKSPVSARANPRDLCSKGLFGSSLSARR